MIEAVNQYTPAHKPAPKGAPYLIVPKARRVIALDEWILQESKPGGKLHNYVMREKAQSVARMRRLAGSLWRRDWKQNNKSDFRVLSHVPVREFLRWRQEDPNFWDDDNNLRSFRRDNPDARVYI